MQLVVHDSEPYVLQLAVTDGVHAPSSEHPDQADQVPVLPSQVRVCVPQLPQLCDEGPAQA